MKDRMGTYDYDIFEPDNKTVSVLDQFSTQLSLSSSGDVLLNRKDVATSPFPDKEIPSAILHWPLKSVNKDATYKEDVIKWRLEMNGFTYVFSDSEFSSNSSNDSSLSEQSSTISSPCTSFTVHSDTQSDDLDRTDIWVSSLDLDEEDSALLPPDKEQSLDLFSSEFLSPSFSAAARSLHFDPSSSTPGVPQMKEPNDSNEPIFWPFERTSYNSPEFDKFLSVSPRRNTADIGYAEVLQLNPVLQRLHRNKLSSAKKNSESHKGTAKGTKVPQDKVQKVAAVPSRLSRTTRAPAPSKHQVPSNSQKRRPVHLKIVAPRKATSCPQLQAHQPLQGIEGVDIRNLADNKVPIEEFIGLDEFNAHEGIQNLSDNEVPIEEFIGLDEFNGHEGIRTVADNKVPIEEFIGLGEFDGHEGICSDSSNHQFSLWLSPR
ncbi:hypothetical protein ACP4OV_010074 [Aristida adscensionis]